MRGLGARHNSLVSGSPSASPRDNRKLVNYWRASEASETIRGVKIRAGAVYIYIYIYIYIYMYGGTYAITVAHATHTLCGRS